MLTARSPYGAVRSPRLRGAFCALAHLPAAQRRLMVMPFGSCQKLGRSFPCWFFEVHRLSSRLTWHDFAYVTMVQKVRSGSVTPYLSYQSDLFKRSGPLHTSHPGPRVTTPGTDGEHTGLLPQEPSELCSTFSRDLPRQQVPFWRGPASVSHGKSSPPFFFAKKCRDRKIPLKNVFSAARGDAPLQEQAPRRQPRPAKRLAMAV